MKFIIKKLLYWSKNMMVFITFLTGSVLIYKGIIDQPRFIALCVTCLFAGFPLHKYLEGE